MIVDRPGTASRALVVLHELVPFVRYVIGRFVADKAPQVASALTYTSLLGLVPLLATLLAIFSMFPAFQDLRETVKDVVLGPLMPAAAVQIREHLDSFLANTKGLGGIGAIGLAVTSVMMISTFEGAFETIWRVRTPRPLVFRILLYWALLTLGPLLLGASLSLSGYVGVLADRMGVSTVTPHLIGLRVFLPAVLATGAFTLLYVAVPHWPVRLVHALIGAVTATVLFEVLKFGFTLYVGNGDNYRAIYGALAVLPIFLLWLYCSWCVVLFGAEVAAALPEWISVRRDGRLHDETPTDRLSASLAVLWELWRLRSDGQGVKPAALERMLGVRWGHAEQAIARMVDLAYIARTEQGRLLLARDLGTVTLEQLARDLGIGFAPPQDPPPHDAPGDPLHWQARLRDVLSVADADFTKDMAMPVATLFGDSAAPEAEALSDQTGNDQTGDDQTRPARGS